MDEIITVTLGLIESWKESNPIGEQGFSSGQNFGAASPAPSFTSEGSERRGMTAVAPGSFLGLLLAAR